MTSVYATTTGRTNTPEVNQTDRDDTLAAKPATSPVPFHRNGYVKIVMGLLVMGATFTLHNIALAAIQFMLGALLFCLGLKLLFDAKK